jgi:50S ribosomal protein L16 3-hydroxylase
MTRALLGGLTPRRFLSRHWQKRPLLVRGALPRFADPVDLAAVRALAQRDDVESRLVVRSGARWRLEHGPLPRASLAKLPERGWTILVQGLNHVVPAAERLLAKFAFVPWARLDDVMVSYAATRGGVGPHVDSYDVFLVQGMGRRRWRISHQRDLPTDPRAPLKVLRGFRAEEEWILEPGDMLYLPPGVVHDGVALEPCMTYSIGFRAPASAELARAFLGWMQERVDLDGMYRDPGLAPAARPGRIPDDMVDRIAATLARVRWSRADVARFVGAWLSEPKAHVFFDPPERPMSRAAFARTVATEGVRLAGATLLLVRGTFAYVNGEEVLMRPGARAAVARLADARSLPAGTKLGADAASLLHDWYCAGFLASGAQHE